MRREPPAAGFPTAISRLVSRRKCSVSRWTRMSNARMFAGSAEINAMVARVAPAILELLADGVPRRKLAIVEALAGRHDRQDVTGTLIRLTVTGQVQETGGKYALAAEAGGASAEGTQRGARQARRGASSRARLVARPGFTHEPGQPLI